MVYDPDGICKIPLHVFLDRKEAIKKSATCPEKKLYPMVNWDDEEEDSEELVQRLYNEALGNL
jgi:hypothetical protein